MSRTEIACKPFFKGELEESSVVRNFRTTASDGKSEGSEVYDKIVQLKLPASDEKIGNSNFSSNVSKSISLMIFYI